VKVPAAIVGFCLGWALVTVAYDFAATLATVSFPKQRLVVVVARVQLALVEARFTAPTVYRRMA
jgi:hypothetical protein